MNKFVVSTLLTCCLLSTECCFSQGVDLLKDSILRKVCSLQCRNDVFYHDGLFPSERRYELSRLSRPDNNIFLSALVALTLEGVRDDFDDAGRLLIDSVVDQVRLNFWRYRNRNREVTYNFWQTQPDLPFPNSRYWEGKSSRRIPDDFDDTSILYLMQKNNDSLNSLVKEKMAKHAEASLGKVRSTFAKYRNYKAYPTWFGKNMKQDFDICVMSNTLMFIFRKGLPLNQYDSATIDLMTEMVSSGEYLRHPRIVSSHYQKRSVILYHLARLLSVAPNCKLDSVRDILHLDICRQLEKEHEPMGRVLLYSSLLRLKERPPACFSPEDYVRDIGKFHFGVANVLSGSSRFAKRIIGSSPVPIFTYHCEAYNWALILEMLCQAGRP